MGPMSTGPLDNEMTFKCCYLNVRAQFSQERSWSLVVCLGHSLLLVVNFPSGGSSCLESGSVVALCSVIRYNHRLAATWLDVMRGSGMVWVTRIIGISPGMRKLKNSLPLYNASLFPRCLFGCEGASRVSQLVMSRVVPRKCPSHRVHYCAVEGLRLCCVLRWKHLVEDWRSSWFHELLINFGPFIFRTGMIFAFLNILISEAKKGVL